MSHKHSILGELILGLIELSIGLIALLYLMTKTLIIWILDFLIFIKESNNGK